MNSTILEAATLFVTNRNAFKQQYSGTLHEEYLEMLFLDAPTRPELSETIPVTLAGFNPKATKHGLDGLPSTTRPNQYAECKVTTTTTPKTRSGIGNITVNDPSQSIIDEYDKYDPLFLFPLYVDGHLVVVFSVEWQYLRAIYVEGLESIYRNNQKKTSGQSASRNFSLTTTKWLDNAKAEFVHLDETIVRKCLDTAGVTKKYKKRVLKELEYAKKSGKIAV